MAGKRVDTNNQNGEIMRRYSVALHDVRVSWNTKAVTIIKQLMENAMKLDVPIIVEMKAGANWNEMEKLKI